MQLSKAAKRSKAHSVAGRNTNLWSFRVGFGTLETQHHCTIAKRINRSLNDAFTADLTRYSLDYGQTTEKGLHVSRTDRHDRFELSTFQKPESTFVIVCIFIIFISLGVIYFRPRGGQPDPKSPASSLQLDHSRKIYALLVYRNLTA